MLPVSVNFNVHSGTTEIVAFVGRTGRHPDDQVHLSLQLNIIAGPG